MTITSVSSDETKKIAELLGQSILQGGNGPFVVALEGDLGAGKTTFVKGLARGLGLRRKMVSPTFLMARRYRLRSNPRGFENLYHADAYRMRTVRDLEVTGVAEALRGATNIVAIEWADLIKKYLPRRQTLWITMQHKKENARILSFKELRNTNSS